MLIPLVIIFSTILFCVFLPAKEYINPFPAKKVEVKSKYRINPLTWNNFFPVNRY